MDNTGAEPVSRLRALLAEAVEHEPADRARYLEAAWAGDTKLRAELDSLLDGCDTSLDFLTDRDLRSEPGGTPAGAPGERVGPYRLVRLIGEGGFGVVYLAEQDQPVCRRVALKVIKAGMDTRRVIARFEPSARRWP